MKILAGSAAAVLMAGGLLVATAPAQAAPYGPEIHTFCSAQAGSVGVKKVNFGIRVSSNSTSGWAPPMSALVIFRNNGGRALGHGNIKTGGRGTYNATLPVRWPGQVTVSIIAEPGEGSAYYGCTARFRTIVRGS